MFCVWPIWITGLPSRLAPETLILPGVVAFLEVVKARFPGVEVGRFLVPE